ncbi:GNAT family N-acetyltransferase [Lacticaseibacillus yichunensis]|uniref:GNAT family N-acetyltransferase n=1 Tax=Lacticaseibacillus yichunensis TaxID=2486015 RepID=A0ABW4CLV3_9LACO|nr:GNAT family N-acetyltransferase [Lacticaseibacillus yichunensis]
MSQTFTIRSMRPADNQAIKQILQQCLQDAGLAIPGTAFFDPQLDTLAEYYQRSPKSAYWVAENNAGKIVGGCGYGSVSADPSVAELQKLYLAPAARGQGLAKALLHLTEGAAKADGYRQLYVVTDTKLPVANVLYQHQGFTALPHALPGEPHDGCDTWYIKDL